MSQNTIVVGNTYIFSYPVEYTTLPDYIAHRGCKVTVVRELTPDESDHRIEPDMETAYVISADDGWCGAADASELIPFVGYGSL